MLFFKKKEALLPLTKESALAFLATQDLTIHEISTLAIDTLGTLFTNERLSKQDEFNLFDKIGEIAGSEDYFRDTMSRDLKQFFAAIDPNQQQQVRGAYLRTLYWRSLLNRKSINDTPNKLPPIGSDRYAAGSD